MLTQMKRVARQATRQRQHFRPHSCSRHVSTVGLLFALIFTSSSIFSQQINQDRLLQWMDQIAQEQLRHREVALAKIHNVVDAERRKQYVRQTILSLLGGLPDYTGPLHPRITGRIQDGNYVIEKVMIESLPGFYVTANL